MITLVQTLGRLVEKIITNLGGRSIAILSASLIIIIVTVMLIDSWIASFNTQTIVIVETRQVVTNLYQLKNNLVSAESAHRGFIITSNPVYLEVLQKSIFAAKENIAFIDRVFFKDPIKNTKNIQWLKAISSSLEAKVSEMKLSISMVKLGNAKGAIEVLNMKTTMEESAIFNRFSDLLIRNLVQTVNTQVDNRRQSTNIARFLVIISGLIWIFLVVIVVKQMLLEISTTSKMKQILTDEKNNCQNRLDEQNKLVRSLALDYQADVERERKKLSSDLHDELGSIFTATRMDVSWVIRKLKDPLDEFSAKSIVEKLERTTKYINRGINFHRHIIEQLHPTMLSTFGFWPALVALVSDAAERNGWALTLDLPDPNTTLNETISLVTYRIVQETINNANKYSNAKSISLFVVVDENFLKVEIEDDGIGIDLSELKGRTHGLSGMQNRVVAIGGHFEIISELGKGVHTRVLIPLSFEPNPLAT